jgi:hypothetical protein
MVVSAHVPTAVGGMRQRNWSDQARKTSINSAGNSGKRLSHHVVHVWNLSRTAAGVMAYLSLIDSSQFIANDKSNENRLSQSRRRKMQNEVSTL